MGRPTKEGLDYFPHDTDAVNDEKIEAMRALFGAEGYAFYFIALERIYRTKTGQLDIGTVEKRSSLTAKIGVEDGRFLDMLNAAFEVGLFDRKAYEGKGLLTSRGVKRRAAEVNKLRAYWRERKRPKYSSGKTGGIPGVFQGENPGKTVGKAHKGKESKVNHIPPKSPRGEGGVFEAYSGGDGALLEALTAFEQMRRKIKKPLTDRARKMLLRRLDELAATPEGRIALLDEAVLHCWQSVYPPKGADNGEEDGDVL